MLLGWGDRDQGADLGLQELISIHNLSSDVNSSLTSHVFKCSPLGIFFITALPSDSGFIEDGGFGV